LNGEEKAQWMHVYYVYACIHNPYVTDTYPHAGVAALNKLEKEEITQIIAKAVKAC
jgi:hypothetical protein